ncbi:hypothetical protein EON64_19715 [archaeon]|nr:MAG: hypothetical protein EON64_19715 [archaeon]
MSTNSSEHPYGFPFLPYPQQLQLMGAITECIETGKVGILESPTGSGKTLSTICATFTWLQKEKERILLGLGPSTIDIKEEANEKMDKEASQAHEDDQEEDWLEALIKTNSTGSSSGHTQGGSKGKRTMTFAQAKAQYERIMKRIDSERDFDINTTNNKRYPPNRHNNTASKSHQPDNTAVDGEDEYLLDPYDSDDNPSHPLSKPPSQSRNFHKPTPSRHPSSNEDSHSTSEDEDEDTQYREVLQLPRIIFATRTFSQCSQFVQVICVVLYMILHHTSYTIHHTPYTIHYNLAMYVCPGGAEGCLPCAQCACGYRGVS